MKSKKYLTSELLTRELQSSFYKFLGILPNPDRVLRRTGKTIDVYRELKNDPHVWSCIQSRKSGTLSLEARIVENGVNKNIVAEIDAMLKSLDLQQIIRDVLEAPLFGFQPLEIIWEIIGQDRKYIVPKAVSAKPQEWFFFDGEGKMMYRKDGATNGEQVPEMKILNARYEASYLNPYGEALLSKCYWPVTFKNGGLRFWVNFTEKYGMPILLGQYTRGATKEEIETLADDLANMTEDAVIVAPADIDIELHEAVKSTSAELYRELIKYCNAEISKAILSQTLTTELDMGSYAAAQTHFRIRREVIQSDIRLVESVMNELIRYIVDLNFSGQGYPKFSLMMNDSENMQKVDRDMKLARTGQIKFTKKYWMENYGFKEEEIASMDNLSNKI
jgi:phage gp29-like protein